MVVVMGKLGKKDIYNRTVLSMIAVVLLGVAAVGVAAAALLRPGIDVPVHSNPIASVELGQETVVKKSDLHDAMVRLDDPSRPFTMVVLGDSTGADPSSWPTLVGEWISSKYNRPVTMHLWNESQSPAGYLPPIKIGEGAGAPVTLYNASAAGKDAAYTSTHLDKMIPIELPAVDLVLINHGHNHSLNMLVEKVDPLVRTISTAAPSAALGLILQNPEEGGQEHAAVQDINTEALRQYANRSSLETVDVREAFLSYGDFRSLYRDSVHIAGEEGYRLWADVVIGALSKE